VITKSTNENYSEQMEITEHSTSCEVAFSLNLNLQSQSGRLEMSASDEQLSITGLDKALQPLVVG